jgi:hypothetical protein
VLGLTGGVAVDRDDDLGGLAADLTGVFFDETSSPKSPVKLNS